MTFWSIRKAVFPIAGLGTRFLPVTKASPKEMLPIVDKPLIQYAVEEAYTSGIRQMIFVTGRTKRIVEDHFDMAFELEKELETTGKNELLEIVRSIKPDDMECIYVRQPRAFGLGHAVLCTRHIIENEPFALLLADDLMVGKPPVLRQMIEKFLELQMSIIAVKNVHKSLIDKYGIVLGMPVDDHIIDLQQLIEKPSPGTVSSTLGIVGRYILTPSIFTELSNQSSGIDGEIQLTDAIAGLLQREKVFAYKFDGRRYDCGTKLGFLQATVDFGVSHAEIGREFSSWLASKYSHDMIL